MNVKIDQIGFEKIINPDLELTENHLNSYFLIVLLFLIVTVPAP